MGEQDELLAGLYDELVTDALESIVNRLEEASRARLDPLPSAEASSRLAEHVGRVVSIVLESLSDEERTTTGMAIVQDVIDVLAARSPDPTEIPLGADEGLGVDCAAPFASASPTVRVMNTLQEREPTACMNGSVDNAETVSYRRVHAPLVRLVLSATRDRR